MKAWDIILEGRDILAKGGRLYSQGSNGVPSRLRRYLLSDVDKDVPVTLTTASARCASPSDLVIEHIVPMKRIAIEIIDPEAHDPRTGGNSPQTLGPARNIDHAREIAATMIEKAYVTREEHSRLNAQSASYQWDAPGGDGHARYRGAGIELKRI